MTQAQLAAEIGINRSTLADYEVDASRPKPDRLQKIANFFKVTIDSLLSEDVVKTDKTDEGNLRVLAVTVDQVGQENIVFVSQQAESSYIKGYNDTNFLKALPNFQVPKLSTGTYRAFEISEDVMPMVNLGSIAIGSYVSEMRDIIDDYLYILVAKNGIVFRRVKKSSESLELISDNLNYRPSKMSFNDILEVWRFVSMITYGESGAPATVDNLFNKLNAIDSKIDFLVNQ